jgi:hypothetical protein
MDSLAKIAPSTVMKGLRRWRWQDYAMMAFGVLLFATPFIFGMTGRKVSLGGYALGGMFVAAGIRPISEPRGGAKLNGRRLYWLPGTIVIVGVVTVLVGTLFLPWIVGEVTRGLAGESSQYAKIVFVGASVVGGGLGLTMLARGPSAALAWAAILWALFEGWVVVLGYEAYTRRVERLTTGGGYIQGPGGLVWDPSANWHVALGPGPYVAGVGIIIWIIGALVGFARRRPAMASPVASMPMQTLGPPPAATTPPET